MALLPKFDPTRLDLTGLDLTRLDLGRVLRVDPRLTHAARDAAYVAIGFGVLGFQQLQVRRRELAKVLASESSGRAQAK